jgi:hypothetical protein
MILRCIRHYLRRTAAAQSRDYELNRRLGSAETVKAIEFLARSDLADDESALEPGAPAKSEEAGRLLLAEIRKGRGTPGTPAAPASPVAAPDALHAAPRDKGRRK